MAAEEGSLSAFSEINVEFGRDGTTAVVYFAHNALVNPRYLQRAQRELEELIHKDGLVLLILDLAATDQAGSSLFGLILHLAEEGRGRGITVRVCSLHSSLHRAFDLLNGDGLVAIFADRRTALRAAGEERKKPWWKFWG